MKKNQITIYSGKSSIEKFTAEVSDTTMLKRDIQPVPKN